MSLFFTTNAEGFLEIRDFLLSHSSPVLQIKIADYALHCIKVRLFFSRNALIMSDKNSFDLEN